MRFVLMLLLVLITSCETPDVFKGKADSTRAVNRLTNPPTIEGLNRDAYFLNAPRKGTKGADHPPGESFRDYDDPQTKARTLQEQCAHDGTLQISKAAETIANDGSDVSKMAGVGNVCRHYEKFRQAGVPEIPLKQALLFYQKNRSKFLANPNKISIADYSSHSKNKRFFILDLTTGKVERERVSHGSGKINKTNYGDSKRSNGVPDACRHTPENARKKHLRYAMTRPGFAKTAELDWSSGHGASSCHNNNDINPNNFGMWPCLQKEPRANKMYMDGLSPGVNENMRNDEVVMHEANYNINPEWFGRSFGCPAFEPGVGRKVVKKIKGGSLFYSYVPQCYKDMEIIKKQVKGWENFCE